MTVYINRKMETLRMLCWMFSRQAFHASDPEITSLSGVTARNCSRYTMILCWASWVCVVSQRNALPNSTNCNTSLNMFYVRSGCTKTYICIQPRSKACLCCSDFHFMLITCATDFCAVFEVPFNPQMQKLVPHWFCCCTQSNKKCRCVLRPMVEHCSACLDL